MSTSAPIKVPSKSALARYLESCRAEAPTEDDIPLRPPGVDVEASDAQQQLWLHSQLARNLPLYNEPVTIHIPDELHIPSFERAFNHILSRHEAWRTAYQWRENKLIQVVIPQLTVSIPFVDLRHEPQERRDVAALAVASRYANPPIDISKPPLFRPLLVRLEGQSFRFYITLHHIIFDGVSLFQIFLPELHACYLAFRAGSTPGLPEPPIQYADYCFADGRRSEREPLQERMQYWEQQFQGILPSLNLPLDRARPTVRNYRGETETFSVSPVVADRLRAFGQQQGATPFVTFLAAFHVLLYHVTQGDCDQLIGSVSSTRGNQKTERILGYFLNTIVLRTTFRAEQTFFELLSKVRVGALDALSNEVPFGVLVQRFGNNRIAGMSPLFQVMFSLQVPVHSVDVAWRLTQMDVSTGTSKFDLYVEVDDRPDALIGRFMYSSEIFDRATIIRMRQQWTDLLNSIADNPSRTVAQLSASLSDSQRSVAKTGTRSFMRFLGRR